MTPTTGRSGHATRVTRRVRSYSSVDSVLGVNAPMILFNGALIYDHRDGRTLSANPIPAETARAVAKMMEGSFA